MIDKFDTLCELDFTDIDSGTTVTARLGFPTFDPTQEWFCLSGVVGADEGTIQRLYGLDPFQAISLSFQRFGLLLAKLPGDFRTPAGDAPHTVFPREIPWTYGSDVYGRLCKLVDQQIEKIEDERKVRQDKGDRKEDPV